MEVAYTGRKESGGNLSVSPDRYSSPMDVMMKSSLGIRSLRIVERPYDVLVTDSTPGKECASSASYGLGQIPDKWTKMP